MFICSLLSRVDIVCVSLCVVLYVCICICRCICIRVCVGPKSMWNISTSLLPTLLCERGSLSLDLLLSNSAGLAARLAPWLLLSLPTQGPSHRPVHLTFNVDARDLNSGPPAYTPATSSVERSLTPGLTI